MAIQVPVRVNDSLVRHSQGNIRVVLCCDVIGRRGKRRTGAKSPPLLTPRAAFLYTPLQHALIARFAVLCATSVVQANGPSPV